MTEQVLTYQISEVPDVAYVPYRVAARGDVAGAIATSFGHLLREVASQPAGSVSVAIRLMFTPSPPNGDPQSRLGAYLLVGLHDPALAMAMRVLLEHGPLSQFYGMERICETPILGNELRCACDVTRREEVFEPLNPPEFNNQAPPVYYSIHCSEPHHTNDYTPLDDALGRIDEPVAIEICVEPTDTRKEILNLSRILARLNAVNHDWDRDETGNLLDVADLGDDLAGLPARALTLRPLRRHDPLANEILRKQQRVHEALRWPQLHFHIRVLAASAAVARLLASVVAESAFENGTYRLW